MNDARMSGAADVFEAQGRRESTEDRTNEDWSWMVGEDPTFYLEEPDRSQERD